MEKLKNIYPVEVFNEEFLIPINISAYRLSKDLEIPQNRISQIIEGKRSITADMAMRFSIYFGTSAKFGLGIQDDFEIEESCEVNNDIYSRLNKYRNQVSVKDIT